MSDPTKVSIALDGTPGKKFVEADEPPAVKVVELPEAPSFLPPAHEFIGIARQMYADARERFFQAARPIAIDARLRDFAWTLLGAIGEVSPDEALDALRRHGGEPPAMQTLRVRTENVCTTHVRLKAREHGIELVIEDSEDGDTTTYLSLDAWAQIQRFPTEARADTGARQTSPEGPKAFCGGARIGWESAGCGAALRYEHTAKGIEYWRCPACGNPHWWPVKADGK